MLKNYVLPDDIREDYISSPYNGTRLFDARGILRAYPDDLSELDKYLNSINTSVQIIWGQNDPIALVKNATVLHDRLPHSKLDIFPEAAHFTWEDFSADFLSVTLDWLREEYMNL